MVFGRFSGSVYWSVWFASFLRMADWITAFSGHEHVDKNPKVFFMND